MHAYPRTIVCPILREQCLDATLRYASFLAKWSGARLLIVTIKDGPRCHDHPGTPDAMVRKLDSPDTTHFPELNEVIYEWYELEGEPVTGLYDFVQQVDGDLLVIGNDADYQHGNTLGRLTHSIANCVECNVVLVKQPDRAGMRQANVGAPRGNTGTAAL